METKDLFSNESFEGWKIDISKPDDISVDNLPQDIKDLQKIKIESIESISHLEKQISYYRGCQSYKFLYRGHSSSKYQLLSSWTRNYHKLYNDVEEQILNLVSNIAKNSVWDDYKLQSFNEKLYYLGISRHLGLNCRILDWSYNIWVALSFLLHEKIDKDGDLWILAYRGKKLEEINPLNIKDNYIHIIKGNYYVPDNKSLSNLPLGQHRRLKQSGCFTFCANENDGKPLDTLTETDEDIVFLRFPISKEAKKIINKCNKLICVKEWLYITENDPTLKAIEEINIIADFAMSWQILDASLITKHLDKSFICNFQMSHESLQNEKYKIYLEEKFATLIEKNRHPKVEIVDNSKYKSIVLKITQNENVCFHEIFIKDKTIVEEIIRI